MYLASCAFVLWITRQRRQARCRAAVTPRETEQANTTPGITFIPIVDQTHNSPFHRACQDAWSRIHGQKTSIEPCDFIAIVVAQALKRINPSTFFELSQHILRFRDHEYMLEHVVTTMKQIVHARKVYIATHQHEFQGKNGLTQTKQMEMWERAWVGEWEISQFCQESDSDSPISFLVPIMVNPGKPFHGSMWQDKSDEEFRSLCEPHAIIWDWQAKERPFRCKDGSEGFYVQCGNLALSLEEWVQTKSMNSPLIYKSAAHFAVFYVQNSSQKQGPLRIWCFNSLPGGDASIQGDVLQRTVQKHASKT